jgi:23S rRNA (guanosine2251-2'-O)-methyltransferase
VERRQEIGRHNSRESDFIYGIRAVLEALSAGQEIEKVLIQKDLRSDLIRQLISQLKELAIPFHQVPPEKLHRLTRKNHQGVICFISPIQYQSLDHVIESCYARGKDPFLVILDRVTDVRNFGAIARTMECAGADALVIQSRGNALVGGDAMKTSAGALNLLPVCREENLKNTLINLKNTGIRVIGCTEKTETSLYNSDLSGPIAIVMGSEEDGISGEYLKLCDLKVKIPMSGKIESLNVSVSTGIVIYEALRQRSTTDQQ